MRHVRGDACLSHFRQAVTFSIDRPTHHIGAEICSTDRSRNVFGEEGTSDRNIASQLLNGAAVVGGNIALEGRLVDVERAALVS